MVEETYPVSKEIANNAFITESIYKEWYPLSIENPEQFWQEQAKKFITWFEPWTKVLSTDGNFYSARWFENGKLNTAYNCLDRHLPQRGNQVALIWEGDNPEHTQKFTYRDLYERVCLFANVLKSFGIKKGDRVCIYLPMIPEAVIAMLACTRIGAIHSIVFAGFSAEALKTRILDAQCSLVITANESIRNNTAIPLKQNVDMALTGCPGVKTVIVVKRTKSLVPWQPDRDYWYHNLMLQAESECPAEIMDANDPLFILYTSGSTGKPKGILHGTGGYLLYVAMTFKFIFDYHPNEIFWCTADIGWITGHSYTIYGPLLNGGTTLIFEGVPLYPTPARYWQIIDKHKVNIFYTAPTAIRALRREGNEWVQQTNRQSLRILGTVGEPINPAAWEWYYRIVGEMRCPVVDTWWQTETGGIMISALPGAMPLKPASACLPFFGVSPKIVDDEGKELPAGKMGKLLLTQSTPGMMQTVWGDRERYLDNYFRQFPGFYLTGDQAYQDQDGYYFIEGRSDDVIKVSGHRIGTQEVESALIAHPAVAEAAVVAVPDPIKGQSIYAFVTLKIDQPTSSELKKELINSVKKGIGAIATPGTIQWTEALPKTRSGKIMRRVLRKIANDETEDLGDLSTLADPNVVENIIQEKKSQQ